MEARNEHRGVFLVTNSFQFSTIVCSVISFERFTAGICVCLYVAQPNHVVEHLTTGNAIVGKVESPTKARYRFVCLFVDCKHLA